jgi:hypothetical protein
MGGLKRLLLAGALAAASAVGAAGQARADDDTATPNQAPGADTVQVPSVIEIQEEEVTAPTVDQLTATANSIQQGTAYRQKADAANEKADKLAVQGGWAWKSGDVQRAQRDAAKYDYKADQEFQRAGVATSCSCPATPEVQTPVRAP